MDIAAQSANSATTAMANAQASSETSVPVRQAIWVTNRLPSSEKDLIEFGMPTVGPIVPYYVPCTNAQTVEFQEVIARHWIFHNDHSLDETLVIAGMLRGMLDPTIVAEVLGLGPGSYGAFVTTETQRDVAYQYGVNPIAMRQRSGDLHLQLCLWGSKMWVDGKLLECPIDCVPDRTGLSAASIAAMLKYGVTFD